MHRLERPDDMASGETQRRDRIGVAVLPEPRAAPIVRARAAGWYEHQVALRISGEHRPGVRRAGVVRPRPAPSAPGRVGGILRHRVPRPPQRPGAHVERAHLATGRLGAIVVRDRRADDDRPVGDERGRGLLVLRRLEWGIAQAAPEVDHAGISEVGARLSRCRVELQEPRVHRGRDDAPATGLTRCAREVQPGRDPSAGVIAEAHRPVHPRIERPPLSARLCIQRDDATEGGDDVHPSLHHDRRHLEGATRNRLAGARDLPGAVGPRHLESGDRRRVDVGERRVARAEHVAAVRWPIVGCRRGCRCEHGDGGRQRLERRHARARSE